MKRIFIKDPIYDSELTVMLGASRSEVETELRAQGPKYEFTDDDYDRSAQCWTLTYRHGGDPRCVRVVVAMKDPLDNINTPAKVGTLAHELFHAVCSVMDYVGGTLDSSSEESFAYLLDYYMTQTLQKS